MSGWMIRERAGFPPQGIQFVDPRTPENRDFLDDHTGLDDRARQVIKFRMANPNIYPEPEWTDFNFVREQVAFQNCVRLSFDATYCYQDIPYVPPAALPPRVCPADGTALTPHAAACCGGRVTYYECPKCGTSYPL